MRCRTVMSWVARFEIGWGVFPVHAFLLHKGHFLRRYTLIFCFYERLYLWDPIARLLYSSVLFSSIISRWLAETASFITYGVAFLIRSQDTYCFVVEKERLLTRFRGWLIAEEESLITCFRSQWRLQMKSMNCNILKRLSHFWVLLYNLR